MHVHIVTAMPTRKRKTEIRRDQIARVALRLIARHGLASLNLVRVARAVGVVPSALYRHFRSKDAILEAVLDLVAERLLANVASVRRETDDPLERLRRLLTRHVDLVRHEIPIPRVVLSEDIFVGHRRRRRRVHDLFRAYLEEIARVIDEGQRSGHLRRDRTPSVLSVMFLGLVQPAAILWLMSEGDFDLVGQVDAAWVVFADAIRA